MKLFTLDDPGGSFERKDLLVAVAVSATNVVRDWQENLRNLVGGHQLHYEQLLEQTVERALGKLSQKAQAQGYDGVLGIRISHPHISDGSVEVVVSGTGFCYERN